jgi:hypothetical protein
VHGSGGGGGLLDADDLALDLLVLLSLDLDLVAVDLIVDRGADDKVSGVHGLFMACPADVGMGLRLEEQVEDLVLLVLALGSGGLDVLEIGLALELVGQSGEYREADSHCEEQGSGSGAARRGLASGHTFSRSKVCKSSEGG